MLKYSMGIGLTDQCNLRCPHCYSRSSNGPTFLSAKTVAGLCKSVAVKNVNLGTGESGLHPQFLEIVEAISDQGMAVALTTNGYSVARLSARELRRFHDIDFSLDFPSEAENDSWRGRGSFQAVVNGVHRCQEAAVEVSVACCLMKTNYKYMGAMVELCAQLGTNLRINVYKSVHTDAYKMTYAEFWEGIRLLLGNSKLLSCSEPIVNALIGHRPSVAGSPCGRESFRVKPSGEIVPCVYWNGSSVHADDVLSQGSAGLDSFLERSGIRHVPEVCTSCGVLDICGGGCAGRRLYHGLSEPDEYCFRLRGDVPQIKFALGDKKELVHSGYLCTIIVSGE